MEPEVGVLESLLRELFEKHWMEITFVPCVQGAVYEIRLTEAPKRITLADGYLTVDVGAWHFHLCIGEQRGSPTNPVPEALKRKRRASKAAFFYRTGDGHVGGSWGFRMWNGAGEQMLTVFFPNPYLDKQLKPQPQPDWSRLALWNTMRLKYLPGALEWMPKEKAEGFGRKFTR
ncbi:MAG: hypothetical protein HY581_09665 [Nitrospirae bacterium]|nr:hypothetical protein [Nitrospirota bacterium]